MKTQKTITLIDANGGSYYVISGYGWSQDANPFRAFMKLAERSYVTGSLPKSKDRKSDGSLIETADSGIMVYYVEDDSKVHALNFFRPVDKDNNPLGVLVYGGSNNCKFVAKLSHKG